jgi:hypothetical protein
MKIYKNYTSGTGSIFSILFSFFIAVVILLCIIDEVRLNEYRWITYYLITIIPIVFLIVSIFRNFYGKIILNQNRLYINKIFYNEYIPFYNIVEIEKPYIMTINKIIFLFPEDNEFWIELNRVYIEHCKINENYYCKTDDLYEKLFAIMLELNEEEFGKNKNHIIQRLPIYIIYFIFFKKMINFSKKYSLYSDYFNNKRELKKYIREYKNKPNFS